LTLTLAGGLIERVGEITDGAAPKLDPVLADGAHHVLQERRGLEQAAVLIGCLATQEQLPPGTCDGRVQEVTVALQRVEPADAQRCGLVAAQERVLARRTGQAALL